MNKSIIVTLLLLASCAYHVPTIRTPYELTTHNGFIVSNIYTNPVKLDHTDEGLEIEYDIVVKNLAQYVRDIDLDGASLVSREKATPMQCRSFNDKKEYFKVAANETFRIQCKGTLHKLKNTRSDAKLYIAIPLGGQLTKFSYIVRAEELQ